MLRWARLSPGNPHRAWPATIPLTYWRSAGGSRCISAHLGGVRKSEGRSGGGREGFKDLLSNTRLNGLSRYGPLTSRDAMMNLRRRRSVRDSRRASTTSCRRLQGRSPFSAMTSIRVPQGAQHGRPQVNCDSRWRTMAHNVSL